MTKKLLKPALLLSTFGVALGAGMVPVVLDNQHEIVAVENTNTINIDDQVGINAVPVDTDPKNSYPE
jgi:hypothetical protein